MFEAVVGAVLLDRGYERARSFTLKALAAEFEAVSGPRAPANPKSTLQELVQSQGNAPPSYRIADARGADHAREFTAEVLIAGKVAGTGTGSRKTEA